MGKWTPDYLDDVLHSKIKNLVSGSISRSSLEKTEPTISYENFVNDLDIGDSFTTSLVDILVKELAERRTRPNLNDRRLIADRSAKSLRLLATPLRVYRDRSLGRFHPTRRSANLTEYLTAPPSEMDMEEDEDIFERMLDNGTLEGARTNSDLYDAYTNHGVQSARVEASPSPTIEEVQAAVSSRPPPGRSGPWSMPPAASLAISSNGLTRQQSIRRPSRSRTVDFNDFTHRRRSSIRETRGTEAPDIRVGPWSRNSESTRRFFPFSRTRRHESSENFPWSDGADTLSADASEDGPVIYPSPSSPAWFTFTPPPQASTSSTQEVPDAETSDERAFVSGARIRRRLRSVDPVSSHPAPPVSVRPVSPTNEPTGDASAYPTPGSTDNENAT
ncbi:hypothetical protein BDZ94DRAFT_1290537 [Collybia nuda]|uniref:Uncharacterized protein n=1 Tax=Collybia nuda TaxID=64659 RepID=A0A9P5Y298_9AGAR|nr:hypothetical protein BDZ94DRAFT_1290537 [Collybia nuda]